VEAQVFEQQDLAGLELFGHGQNLGTDTVRSHAHLAPEQFRQAHGHGLEGKFRSRGSLGPAEMGTDDQRCAIVQSQFQGRQTLLDAVVVDNGLAFEGHVVIDAHKDTFAAHVQFIQKSHMIFLPWSFGFDDRGRVPALPFVSESTKNDNARAKTDRA